jgi:hypothetical protein
MSLFAIPQSAALLDAGLIGENGKARLAGSAGAQWFGSVLLNVL